MSRGAGTETCPIRRSHLPATLQDPSLLLPPCLTQFLIQIWPQAQALAYFRYTSFLLQEKKRPTRVTLKQGVYCGDKWGQERGGGGGRKPFGTETVLVWNLFSLYL